MLNVNNVVNEQHTEFYNLEIDSTINKIIKNRDGVFYKFSNNESFYRIYENNNDKIYNEKWITNIALEGDHIFKEKMSFKVIHIHNGEKLFFDLNPY